MNAKCSYIVCALLGAVSAVSPAADFLPISSVSTDMISGNPAGNPLTNIIQGPGAGFAAAEPHAGPSATWYTNAVVPDYVNGRAGLEQLVFDMGADVNLNEISYWGYASSNANGMREFSLEFATDADGPTGFGTTITDNPSFAALQDPVPRQSFDFQQVTARYVRLTALSTFYAQPGAGAGGDRLGIGEIAFEDRFIGPDPDLEVAADIMLDVSRNVESFEIPVTNIGAQDLEITGVTFTGTNMDAFSPVIWPGPLGQLASGTITIAFDPTGLEGAVSVTMEVASNDPDSPTLVNLTGEIPPPPSDFYPISSVVSNVVDFYASLNLIQGKGVGFETESPHDQIPGAGNAYLWVTEAPNGGAGDYFNPVPDPAPVLIFDLGQDVLLTEVSIWGYSSGNANGVSDFSLRFATDAEGDTGFGSSITYNPLFTAPFGFAERGSFPFALPVTARYVELTPLDNYFGSGLAPGGDRVGIGEVAFEEIPVRDPILVALPQVDVSSNGSPTSVNLNVSNAGASNDLTISSITPGGTNAAGLLSIVNPGTIAPGGTETIDFTFDPQGASGDVSATLEIASNDSELPVFTVNVTGYIRDPWIVGPASITATFPDNSGPQTISETIQNLGFSNALTVSNVVISGGDAAHFSVATNPSPVAAETSADFELSFDPMGEDGYFLAELSFDTNDPSVPGATIPIIVTVEISDSLVAWWPLDADGTDASGNGHNGVLSGNTPATSTGAISATGPSLDFDGASRFDVPYSPELNPTSFTVVLWANADAGAGGYHSPITSRDDTPSGTHGYILYDDVNGNWSFWTGQGAAGWPATTGPAVNVGNWEHIAITYDELTNTKILYVNCVEVARSSRAATFYVPNGTVEQESLHIAGGGDTGAEFNFDGRLDDIALFRTALTPEQLQIICDSGVDAFVNPIDPFKILSIVPGANAGEVNVTFESIPGRIYYVQTSGNLMAWDTDANAVIGDFGGDQTTIPVTITGDPLFIRIEDSGQDD